MVFVNVGDIGKHKHFSKDIINEWKLEEKIDIVIKPLTYFKFYKYMIAVLFDVTFFKKVFFSKSLYCY